MVISYKLSDDIPTKSVGNTVGLLDNYGILSTTSKVVMSITVPRGKLILFEAKSYMKGSVRVPDYTAHCKAIKSFVERHKHD